MANKIKTAGFTLIEMVVSIFLSGIVLTAAFGMFVSANKAFQSTGEASMTMQTARAAIDIMSAEIEMAGMGTISPKDVLEGQVTSQGREDNISVMDATLNGADGASDVLQFRSSIGGMVLLGSPISYSEFTSGALASLDVQQGQDLLRDGDAVYVMGADRSIYGSATISTISGSDISITNWGAYSGAPGISQFQTGTVIISRPLVYTYTVDSSGRLLRCVRLTDSDDCDVDHFLDAVPTAGSPNTTYIIANNVRNMQFSYYLSPDLTDPNKSSGWQPDSTSAVPLTNLSAVDDRIRIRAVKIELLVRSEGVNPMIKEADCSNGMIKTQYFLGDSSVDITDNGGCVYNYVQVSNIVKIPNAIYDI